MADFFWELLQNRVLMAAAAGWLAAQVLKTLLVLIMERELRWERLVGSGGMPSSHSATVCALASSSAAVYGPGSGQFAIAAIVAFIVMYDATGVRRSAGEQAKTLNQIISHLLSENQIPIDMTVREIFGHTPFQVLMGALLGIAMPLIFRIFF